MKSYGDDGKAYINWCAKMADSLGIGIPWIMCKQPGPPKPMVCLYTIKFTFTYSTFLFVLFKNIICLNNKVNY